MTQPISTATSTDIKMNLGAAHWDHIKKFTGMKGRLMGLLGAVKVKDDKTGQEYYVKVNDVVKELFDPKQPITGDGKKLIGRRILEIADSDTTKPLSQEKLEVLFDRYYADKAKDPGKLATEKGVINEIEKLKQEMSDIPQLYYSESMNEITGNLKPGDIFIRKYHEDNSNPICTLQKFFNKDGYREAYKCSHLAIYLGELQGCHWVAEASMPHGHQPEVRRIRIDDPRFDLMKKNQYMVIRNKDEKASKELARLARNYCIKMWPETEKRPVPDDTVSSFSYNFLEAARSLWHSSKLAFFGTHRLLKYHADYKNKIPFEYLGSKRAFFCSHFALIMESLSEMNKSEKFQKFIAAHPVPKYDHSKTGLALKVSQLGYSIKKGLWSRWMALRFGNEIKSSVSTQLDALRTTPQDAVIYMMDHKKNFDVIGLINHQGDLE